MLAVGEQLWGGVDDRTLRMTTSLAGGLGCSFQEQCGALSGGSLLIGALYGRISPEEDDSECNRRVCEFRERFLQQFGATRCQDVRDSGYGSEGQWPCSALVEQTTRILWQVLEE